jgi:hypothetical protein
LLCLLRHGIRHPAEAAIVEIAYRSMDLGLAIHDEGAMTHDKLIDRLAREYQWPAGYFVPAELRLLHSLRSI